MCRPRSNSSENILCFATPSPRYREHQLCIGWLMRWCYILNHGTLWKRDVHDGSCITLNWILSLLASRSPWMIAREDRCSSLNIAAWMHWSQSCCVDLDSKCGFLWSYRVGFKLNFSCLGVFCRVLSSKGKMQQFRHLSFILLYYIGESAWTDFVCHWLMMHSCLKCCPVQQDAE